MIDPRPGAVGAPANPNVAPFNSHHHDRLCRVGLWLGVLGAALCIGGAGGERIVAEQGARAISMPLGVFLGVGIPFAALFALAIFLPYAWARITGIGLLGAAGFAYALVVIVARSDERLLVGPTVTVGSAGLMLVLAFVATCVGMVFALVGAPRIGRPARRGASGEPISSGSGYAVTSLVLSLSALAVAFTAPLGIAFAVAAFDDATRSDGARTGRGMAIAGLVVGLVILSLAVLAMAITMASADPSLSE